MTNILLDLPRYFCDSCSIVKDLLVHFSDIFSLDVLTPASSHEALGSVASVDESVVEAGLSDSLVGHSVFDGSRKHPSRGKSNQSEPEIPVATKETLVDDEVALLSDPKFEIGLDSDPSQEPVVPNMEDSTTQEASDAFAIGDE